MKNKTHYRKVFKSDHLGVADLEEMLEDGKTLVFTIDKVNQEFNTLVAGKKINANIAYFKEKIKPLVLNATNSKAVRKLNDNSAFVEDWAGTRVELYIDASVSMKREVVGGVRLKKAPEKETLTPDSPKWNAAKDALKLKKTTIESIKKIYTLSDANAKLLTQ